LQRIPIWNKGEEENEEGRIEAEALENWVVQKSVELSQAPSGKSVNKAP
jgi:hypothetical protein